MHLRSTILVPVAFGCVNCGIDIMTEKRSGTTDMQWEIGQEPTGPSSSALESTDMNEGDVGERLANMVEDAQFVARTINTVRMR